MGEVLVGKIQRKSKVCIKCGSEFLSIEDADICVSCRDSEWIDGYLHPDLILNHIQEGTGVCFRGCVYYSNSICDIPSGLPDYAHNLKNLFLIERTMDPPIWYNAYFAIGFDNNVVFNPLFLFGRTRSESELLWSRFGRFANHFQGFIYGDRYGLNNYSFPLNLDGDRFENKKTTFSRLSELLADVGFKGITTDNYDNNNITPYLKRVFEGYLERFR